MKHRVPELPYAADALEAHISAETFAFHHGKHHRACVTKPNELIAGQSTKISRGSSRC